MMMDGRHKEDALVRKVEVDNLNHDRQGLNDKQATDDEGDDLGVSHDGRTGKRGTQSKRAGITHKDARRIAVEPQKARQAPAHAVQKMDRFTSPCKNAMAAMASMAIMEVPPARPSRPSVKFTALERPAIISQQKTI